ncbi:hypothetical protein KPL74_01825 [Bacillus sp. NP157]|nr:hypothetical protein KPL74_01825 [Bacillus sp. NP157]
MIDELQRVRRKNLRLLLNELKGDGIRCGEVRARLLGISPDEFARLVDGAPIGDRLARDVEWAMNRPRGWLDEAAPDTIA